MGLFRLDRVSCEARFGNRTLSSLALPIFEFGSFCSLNILNLADKVGLERPVKSHLRKVTLWQCLLVASPLMVQIVKLAMLILLVFKKNYQYFEC